MRAVTSAGEADIKDNQNHEADDISVRFAAGAPEALREAYQRFSPLVYTLALRALDNRQDAEDVTQLVFVAAWRGRHTLRPGSQALPRWLVGITRHRIADQYQQGRRLRRDAAAAVHACSPPLGLIDQVVQDRIIVQNALTELGEPRSVIIQMAVLQGHTHHEVADLLDLPLGTVKSHIRRGLIQLRNYLEEVDP